MPQVATAAEMSTRAAEGSEAWMFFANMAVLQALHRHEPHVFNPDRKDHHWGKRKLKRDELPSRAAVRAPSLAFDLRLRLDIRESAE